MMNDAREASGSGTHQAAPSKDRRVALARVAAMGCAVGVALVVLFQPAAGDAPVFIELVSQTLHGQSAEGRSEGPAVNADGQFVAYGSNAIDLVSPPFQNPRAQIYLRDLDAVTSELISKAPDGRAGNLPSQPSGFAPGVSGDGRFVAFSSSATNLVADDTDGRENVYVYDRTANAMELISRGTDGPSNGASSFPRISADGRYVVFQSTATNLGPVDANPVADIYLYDRTDHVMVLVSLGVDGAPADGPSITPTISDDGHVVAYASRATNLVAAPATGGTFEQIFVTEWENQVTTLASVSSAGTPGNATSFLPDLTSLGDQVAFKSEAFNLVPNDTNGVPDVFVRNRAAGTTERVSVDDFGNQSNGLSGAPGISGDGRFVAFISFASNFVPDDGNGLSDVYVYDRHPPGRAQGLIARVSVGMGGTEPNDGVSDFPVSVSTDGRWIGFSSAASNLVPNDTNNNTDVFLACNPFDATQCAPLPTATPTITPTPTSGVVPCIGDCNGDGEVTIDDLVRMVNIALGLRSVCGDEGGAGQCLAGDANCDCEITVDEIIKAVNNSLNGCTEFGDCTLESHALMCCGGPLDTPTPSVTPTQTPPQMPCTTPEDCPPGEVCVDGFCVPATPTATPTSGPAGPCIGDCTGNGVVTIDELVRMVNIALGLQTLCPSDDPGCLAGDAACDCEITVDDVIKAVNNSLNGCSNFAACSPAEHTALCCEG